MDDHQTIVALGTILVGMATVIVLMAKTLVNSRIAAQQSTAANRATNGIGEGEHRLYDMVSHIRDEIAVLTEAQQDFTEKGWRHLPADIGDATALTLKIRYLEEGRSRSEEAHEEIRGELAKLLTLLEHHELEHENWRNSQ